MNDIHTHTQRQGEGVSDKRWARFADLTPFIHLSLSLPPPPVRSVILSVPSALLPLSGSGQSLADPDKRMLLVMEKEQRSWLSKGEVRGGGVAGCQGWKAIVKAVAIHCCFWARSWSDAYLAHLLCLRFPSVHLFHGPPSFFSGVRDGNVEKGKCDRCLAWSCSPVQLALLLGARWRSALSAPPLLVLVVNTPGRQSLGQLSVAVPVSSYNLLHLFTYLLVYKPAWSRW